MTSTTTANRLRTQWLLLGYLVKRATLVEIDVQK